MVYSKPLGGKSRIVKLVREMKKKIGSFTWAVLYITFDRKDASLAFARESLTRSFVPWRHDVHVLFCLVTLDMTSETRVDV